MRTETRSSLRSTDRDLAEKDRDRFLRNAVDLVETAGDLADLEHLLSTWHEDNSWTPEQARAHLADCPGCGKTLSRLTVETEISPIPFAFHEETHVRPQPPQRSRDEADRNIIIW